MKRRAYAQLSKRDILVAPRTEGEYESAGRGHVERSHRTTVNAAVILNAESGGVQATACDVSSSGLRIAVDAPPATGPITVKLVGLPIFSGKICWRGDRQIGVELEQPLSPDCLSTWISIHGLRRRPGSVA